MMFSYGSGCAASMFELKVRGDYSHIQKNCHFQDRLDKRVKVTP
jgi:hydroxymethylglutaryl-CoA synthase